MVVKAMNYIKSIVENLQITINLMTVQRLKDSVNWITLERTYILFELKEYSW